jgi:hypothetical protein
LQLLLLGDFAYYYVKAVLASGLNWGLVSLPKSVFVGET